MYDYFKARLWTQIEEQSTNFWEEVKHFKDIIEKTRSFCQPVHKVLKAKRSNIQKLVGKKRPVLRIEKSKWNEEFTMYPFDCILMAIDHVALRQVSPHKTYSDAYNESNLMLYFPFYGIA